MVAQANVSDEDVQNANLSLLNAATELSLLQRLAEYPAMLSQATADLAPHQVAFWLRDCAADFHSWYNAERVNTDNQDLKLARLALATACAQVIANGLNTLGVSAPQKM